MRKRYTSAILLVAAVTGWGLSRSAQATSYTWVGQNSGNWGTSTEWGVPVETGITWSAGDTAVFDNNSFFGGGGVLSFVDSAGLDASFTVGNITKTTASGGRSMTWNSVGDGAGKLIFSDLDGLSSYASSNGSSGVVDTWNVLVELQSHLTLTVTGNSTSTIKFNKSIGESGGSYWISKRGTRTVELNAANAYSGGTTIGDGIIRAGHAQALGTGQVRLAPIASAVLEVNAAGLTIGSLSSDAVALPTVTYGGTNYTQSTTSVIVSAPDLPGGVQATATATVTSGAVTSISIANHGSGYSSLPTFTVVDSDAGSESAAVVAARNEASNVQLGSATLTIAGTNASAVTFSGAISGGGAVVKNGDGTQVFTGANAYAGGTTVSAGVLRLAGSGTLGGGDVTVSGGMLDLQNLAGAIDDSAVLSVGVDGQVLLAESLVEHVGGLFLGGIEQLSHGTYGGVGSGADHESSFFSGSGFVSVPEPASAGIVLLGVGVLTARRRVRRAVA